MQDGRSAGTEKERLEEGSYSFRELVRDQCFDSFICLDPKAPPFTLSDKTIYLLSVISQQLGKFMLKEPKWKWSCEDMSEAYRKAMAQGEQKMFSVAFLADVYNIICKEKGRNFFSLSDPGISDEQLSRLFETEALLCWAQRTKIHPILTGCVVHYRLTVIRPFEDGNGRLARIWNNLLFCQWDPILERFPMEKILEGKEEAYLAALRESDEKSDAGPALDFLLSELCGTLCKVKFRNNGVHAPERKDTAS